MTSYIGSAVLGFAMLFGISAAVVYWQERHKRRDRAYWNRDA